MPGKKQIKGEKQLIDLAETTNFLSEQFHEFEADKKLKEEIINSLRSQGSVLHDDLKKMQAQLKQQPQYSRMNYLLFHRIKDEKGEDTDSIISNIVNKRWIHKFLPADLDRSHRIGILKTRKKERQ